MKTTLFLLIILFTQSALAAPYYRFWRGEKITHLGERNFINTMARDFIPQAPKLFPHLTSYLVAVPPQGYGVDEVALLAYTNEEDYLRARNTPEGRGYSDAHWELFERETSKSLVPERLNGRVEANKAYDLIQRDVDWSKGVTFFYMGEKRPGIPTDAFLRRLDRHVKDFKKAFVNKGLKGYVILATEEREYAWINFRSEDEARRAFSSPVGKNLIREAEEIMETIQWSSSEIFKKTVKRSSAYTVK